MDKYLNNGYVGRRNRWKVSDAKEFYDELSSEQKRDLMILLIENPGIV